MKVKQGDGKDETAIQGRLKGGWLGGVLIASYTLGEMYIKDEY